MPTNRFGDHSSSGHLSRILDDKTPQLGGMLDGNGFTFNGAVAFEAQAGEALSKGNAVYVSGVSGNKPVVMKADADDAAKMPAFGIAETDANLHANVNVVTFGTVYEIDTSAYSAGDELYVSTTPGVLTATKPSGATAKLQNIGKVIRSHASAGSIKVGGAGRTNAVPNLDDGTVFIGDSNNQAEQRALVLADISDYVAPTETDPVYTASSWYTTTNNSSNWDTAYGWGDHSTQNYAVTTGDTFTGKLTVTNSAYDNHIELNRSSEQWRISPSTDGSLDIRRVGGTGAETVDFYNNVTVAGNIKLDNASDTNYDVFMSSYYDYDAWFRLTDGGGVVRFSVGRDNHAYVGGAGTAGNKLWDEGDFTSTNISNWNTAYGWGDHSSAGYATSFNSLSAKDGGTGTYRTSGYLQSGTSGSGMVSLTTNDGGGNANVTFNHAGNAPDHAGYNTGRITVNVDSTSGAAMDFKIANAGGTPASELMILPGKAQVTNRLDLTNANLQLTQDSGYFEIQTPTGYTRIGSGNTTWSHFYTDRGGFYFGTGTQFDGYGVRGYDTSTDCRFPIFYDLNDTAYYCDPASTSRLNISYNNETSHSAEHGRGVKFWNSDSYKIYMSSTANTTWGGSASLAASSDYNMYFRMTGGTNRGFVFRNNTTAVAQIDGAGKGYFRDLQVYDGDGASTNYQNIHIGESGTGSASLHLQYRGDGYARFGMGDTSNGTAWAQYSVAQMFYTNNNITFFNVATANGSFRAPIFYDSANTAYYADLASTSRMNKLMLTGTGSINDAAVNGLQASSAYLDLYCNTTNGGGLRVFDNQGVKAVTLYQNGGGEGGLLDNDGSWAVRVRTSTNALELRCNNNHEMSVATSYVIAYGSSRAPLFYDSNNTAYYMNPNSTGDSIRCAGDIVAYYSDERLKDIEGNIPNALDKVCSLNGFYYRGNKKAQALGYDDSLKVGLSAQEVKEVLPEVIKGCPADANYMTLDYAKVVPLLVEAIKDLKAEIEELKK